MRKLVPSADAEALVHDVFATYIATQSRVFDTRAYLIAAICQAARRYHHRRRGEAPFDDTTPCDSDDAEIEAIMERLTLRATLARLKPRCQEILRRRYLQDESTTTIADEMQMTTDNVNYVLHGCRKEARAVYEELARVRR